MAEKLTVDDVEKAQAERDGDGELIATEHEIEWVDGTKVIEVYPTTNGKTNEIAQYEQGLATLEPDAVAGVVSTMCKGLDLDGDDLEDVKTEYLQNLVAPITDQLPEVEAGNR